MCEYSFNKYYKDSPRWDSDFFSFLEKYDILDFHKSLQGYEPTPCVALENLANKLGVKKIYVKDESKRFGLNAFKALGASYAIFRFLKKEWEGKYDDEFNSTSFQDTETINKLGSYTFCAATDGNHGRAVAWTAKKLNQKAVIYMPANTAQSRVDNIKGENAEAVLIDGTFDDCVKQCADDAEKNGWQAIADTAYEGYMKIPGDIMLGYTSIFSEIEELNKVDTEFDFVILQAGVGALAASGSYYYVKRSKQKRPKFICVEPTDSDCFLESIKFGEGESLPTKGQQESIMAGLNCGIPSLVAWPIIRDAMDLFLAISDKYAEEAMREYHKEGIISGESGAAGLAALIALYNDEKLLGALKEIGINSESKILLINTEGDTDPENYRKVVG